jgi:hypothetical protein
MLRTVRTRIALAAAAVALTAVSLAPAATFAAPLTPATSVLDTASPDLDVKIDMVEYLKDSHNLYVDYTLKNIGSVATGAIPIKTECMNEDGDHWLLQAVVTKPMAAGKISAGGFTCKDAIAARITVGTPGDWHTANNVSQTDLWN